MKLKIILLILFSLGLNLTQSWSQTQVSGNITMDETWTLANSPYELIGDVTVDPGVTLTIEPGVQVTFLDNTYDLFVNGTLTAVGNATDSVKFSSNGGNVRLNSGSINSVIDFASFKLLGGFNEAALFISSSSATVSNATFSNCKVGITVQNGASPMIQDVLIENSFDYAIRVDDGSPTIQNSIIDEANDGTSGILISAGAPTIQNNILRNIGAGLNQVAIHIDALTVPVIDGNTFTNNYWDILAHPEILDDLNFDNNGLSVIQIDNKNITSSTTWHEPLLPEDWSYEMTNAVTVDPGVTLTIEPGVEIVFLHQANDLIVNGTLLAVGNASDSIIFSSGGANISLNASSVNSVLDFVSLKQLGAFNGGCLVHFILLSYHHQFQV